MYWIIPDRGKIIGVKIKIPPFNQVRKRRAHDSRNKTVVIYLFRLYYLDLKGNPLSPHLQDAAGDCSSKYECEKAAIRVLKFQAVYKQEGWNNKNCISLRNIQRCLQILFSLPIVYSYLTRNTGVFEEKGRNGKEARKRGLFRKATGEGGKAAW